MALPIIFVAGSRHISRLPIEVKKRLDTIIERRFQILVGDANGADKAVQRHLADKAYAIARKKDKCKIKGTPIANATVNRDLASLKHMLHKAEIWGYVEISPGRRVENLRDDGSVRTDYYTEEQLKLLVSTAAETRGAHPLNFNDWPEFIVLDANTGLRCKEMLFLEFSDIDWTAGVLHVRNKRRWASGLRAERNGGFR